jgi:hypothetical protein
VSVMIGIYAIDIGNTVQYCIHKSNIFLIFNITFMTRSNISILKYVKFKE